MIISLTNSRWLHSASPISTMNDSQFALWNYLIINIDEVPVVKCFDMA